MIEDRHADARRRIAEHDWWHTIEVAPGVVTPGGWDLRPTAERMPWPGSLVGLRCLDVGTFDGFWAFEMERRGAADVLAIDLVDPGRQDNEFGWQPYGGATPASEVRGRTFAVAAELRGSRASYRDLNVYDLDPSDVGEFDLVFMGYVLQMLRDPLRGLAAVHSVCRGHLIVLDTVSAPLSFLPAPLARLSARRSGSEWFVFNRRGLRRALQLTGFAVEEATPILADVPGPRYADDHNIKGLLPHALGIVGRSAAVRGRAMR